MRPKLFLFLILSGLTFIKAQDDFSNVEKLNFVQTTYSNLHYEIYGQGDTVLLLHGCNANIGLMSPLIEELMTDFTVIVVDNPNHGLSDFTGDSIDYKKMAISMFDLLDSLEIQQIPLIGWSDGAIIGLEMASMQTNRMSDLILMSGNYKIDTSVVKSVFFKNVYEEIEHQSDLKIKENLFTTTKYPDLKKDDLKRIESKTLILNADNDIIKCSHSFEMHQLISNSEILIVPNSGHNYPIEKPKITSRIIKKYLSNSYNDISCQGWIKNQLDSVISYVNIGIKNNSIGTISGHDGFFSFGISYFNNYFDTITFTAIGFKDFNLPVADITQDSNMLVRLSSTKYDVPEVIVFNKKIKEKDIGIQRLGLGLLKGVLNGLEKAYLIESNTYPVRLSQVKFCIWPSQHNVKFRINFYNVVNGEPSKLISTKDLVFDNKCDEKGWIVENLQSENLYFKDDFYISIVLLPDENGIQNNRWKVKMGGVGKTYTRDYLDSWNKIYGMNAPINVKVEY